MRIVIALLLLCFSSISLAVEPAGFCEDSPLDIFPDQFYTCEALQSFKKGFDKHALELFKRASRWGSKQSQYKVGLMYVGGFGTRPDPVEGAAWLLLANERNNRESTKQLKLAMSELSEGGRLQANARALELRDEYGDLEALERRSRWVRRMKRRTTGSHLGRPTATLAIIGTQGMTGLQTLPRLDRYEASLRITLTTVEYRDFKVIEPEDEARQDPETSDREPNQQPD